MKENLPIFNALPNPSCLTIKGRNHSRVGIPGSKAGQTSGGQHPAFYSLASNALCIARAPYPCCVPEGLHLLIILICLLGHACAQQEESFSTDPRFTTVTMAAMRWRSHPPYVVLACAHDTSWQVLRLFMTFSTNAAYFCLHFPCFFSVNATAQTVITHSIVNSV